MSQDVQALIDRIEGENKAELDRLFKYHAPTELEVARMTHITTMIRDLAAFILATCPEGAERDMAIMRLREARMMANASLVCRPAPTDDQDT